MQSDRISSVRTFVCELNLLSSVCSVLLVIFIYLIHVRYVYVEFCEIKVILGVVICRLNTCIFKYVVSLELVRHI